MEWSAETVEGLAPDAASVTAARKLARPAPWSETGLRRARGLGAVQGLAARGPTRRRSTSPGRPTSAPARRGSSRASTRWRCCCCGRAGDVAAGAPPAWVAEWLDSRGERRLGRRAAAPGEPPRDPEAAAQARGGARGAGRRRASRTCGAGCATPCAAGSAPGGCAPGTSGTRSRRGWSTPRRRARRRGCARSAASPRGARTAGRSGCCAGSGCCTCCARRTRAPTGRCATTCARCSGLNVGREEVLAGPRVARPLGGARAGRDRAGAPARPAHVAVGRARPAGRRCCSTSRRRARRWSRARRRGWRWTASLAFHPSATPLRALRGRARAGRSLRPGAFGAGGAGEALRAVASRRRRQPVARRVAGRAARRRRRTGATAARGRRRPTTARCRWAAPRRPLAAARRLRRAPGVAVRALGTARR